MSRLDNIPDTGDACFLSRYCDRKRRIRDPRILLDEIDQRTFVDVENLILVAEAMPQANLAHWKFGDFELHHSFNVQTVQAVQPLTLRSIPLLHPPRRDCVANRESARMSF